MVTPDIKRGVSFYSYQDEAFTGRLDLRSMISTSASFGARGIEIIPEQSFDNFPNLTDAQVDEWFALHDEFGTYPVAYDQFLDSKRYPHRMLTEDESVESLKRDIVLADRLDTRIMRIIVSTPAHLVEKVASFAADHNVKLAMEIHAPVRYDGGWVGRWLEMMRRVDNGYIGILPDMGTFTKRLPRVFVDQALRGGATPEHVEYVVENYGQLRTDPQQIPVEVAWAGGTPADVSFAHQAVFFSYTDPRDLLPHMDYMFHIQAKFYEMVDDRQEYSIPYDEIIAVLKEGGYTGHLSSEYEGNRFIDDAFPVDSVEQVRRQHAMFAHLLGEND